MVLFVTKNYHINNLIVRDCSLKNRLNYGENYNHITDTIQSTLGIEVKIWVASMSERAAIDKADLNKI